MSLELCPSRLVNGIQCVKTAKCNDYYTFRAVLCFGTSFVVDVDAYSRPNKMKTTKQD
jgi:hypothetical protein